MKSLGAKLALMTLVIGPSIGLASPYPTFEQIEKAIIARPAPEYPSEALSRHQAGSGVVKLHFKVRTGTIRTIQLTQSTGYKSLDAAAMRAFGKWKLKPKALPPIRSFNPKSKEPFADEDFVAKIPFTFLLARGGKVNVGGPGKAH